MVFSFFFSTARIVLLTFLPCLDICKFAHGWQRRRKTKLCLSGKLLVHLHGIQNGDRFRSPVFPLAGSLAALGAFLISDDDGTARASSFPSPLTRILPSFFSWVFGWWRVRRRKGCRRKLETSWRETYIFLSVKMKLHTPQRSVKEEEAHHKSPIPESNGGGLQQQQKKVHLAFCCLLDGLILHC